MDKKQFFESLITSLPDASGQELRAFETVSGVLSGLKSTLSDPKLKAEFEPLEKEILFRVWMLEQVCNSVSGPQNIPTPGPLIVIFLGKDMLFVNKLYCSLSGVSVPEMQNHAKDGTLYDLVYAGENLSGAREAISRLRVGKGYKQLELTMRHSDKRLAWNSYGGVGGALEIRSGRILDEENEQKKQRELHYRGSLMNTTRVIDNLYQVSIHGVLSPEDEIKLVWIQELLSMLDFLWNHSEFFMEITSLPGDTKGKINGCYNTVYAQFFGRSFSEDTSFRDTLTRCYKESIGVVAQSKIHTKSAHIQKLPFHSYNKTLKAHVSWQSSVYPHVTTPEYTQIFSFGSLAGKVLKKNIFVLMFQLIFRK